MIKRWLWWLVLALGGWSFSLVEAMERVCGEFVSSAGRPSRGTFQIDTDLVAHQNDDSYESFLCIYKFVARPNQKVMLNFTSFDVKSFAPDCLNEYVDIYIELTEETMANYVESSFLSRWCGWKKPKILVSYNNIIIFAYHSDGTSRGSHFSGTYEFISSEPYNIGRVSASRCEYELNSETNPSGVLMSPTYPGTYPNIMNCSYKFRGASGERLSIYFDEILLHFGADHCPYDIIKVYDYQNLKKSKSGVKSKQITPKLDRVLIDTYCGRKLNFTIYSTSNQMDLEFEMSDSLGNEEYYEDENKILLRKGFKLYYKFSKHFADLSFITGTHITGTNCDQHINSVMPTGMIYSPNYFNSIPINATCKYIFEGLNDHFNFESVRLNFQMIETKHSQQLSRTMDSCEDNTTSYFVAYGVEKQNSRFCFSRLTQETKELKSVGSHLTLVFHSIVFNHYTPSNFKANYAFFTEFGIEGTRVYPNRTCLFVYNSQSVVHGYINSPRYPRNYPLNLKCEYVFEITSRYERILFTFKEFKLSNPSSINCPDDQDYLDIHQEYFEKGVDIVRDIAPFRQKRNAAADDWFRTFRYCGTNVIPPPFMSDEDTKRVRFTFDSDNDNYAQGFKMNYNYVRLPECKYTYNVDQESSHGKIIIESDLESNYYCDWYLRASSEESFLFSFKNENLEAPSNQFVIRIYDMSPSVNDSIYEETKFYKDVFIQPKRVVYTPKYEYVVEKQTKFYQLDASYVKVQLVLGKSMMFNSGRLILTWMTISKNRKCQPNEFQCIKSFYCIKSMFFCDKIEHCPDDYSDEPDNCYVQNTKKSSIFPQIVQLTSFFISVIVLTVFFSLCIGCRLRSIRERNKMLMMQSMPSTHEMLNHRSGPSVTLNPAPVYYRYSPANSVDYLEATITSV